MSPAGLTLNGVLSSSMGEVIAPGLPPAGPTRCARCTRNSLDEDDPFLTVVAGDGLYYLIEWTAEGKQTILGTHQYGSQMTDPSVAPLS